MRGGFKVFARNFVQGALLLALIEGFNVWLSSVSTKRYNEKMMELYGFDGLCYRIGIIVSCHFACCSANEAKR